MSDLCTDNRFELIEKYKKELIESTNIETSPEEMKVLDNILFRFWQMGWLDKLELPSAQPEIIRCKDCKYCDTFPEGADNDMPSKCLGIRYGGVYPDWFCEHAERRTDDY